MDKVSTTAYKERSIALTLPSYTPSSIARITSGAILHGQNDTIRGTCVCVQGGKEREGEGEGGRRGGRRLTRKESQQRNLLELLTMLSQNQLERERAKNYNSQQYRNPLLYNVQLITGASS